MSVPLAPPILLLAALAAAPPTPVGPPTSLAPVIVDGMGLDAAVRVEKSLRRSFEARPGAVADAVARPVYEAARQNGLTCDVSLPDCLAQVGVVQGVDVIVLARIGPDTLELTAVDVGSARPTRRAKGTLRAPVLEADISAVFDRLAAPAAALTSLAVTAPSGAAIAIDGSDRGVAPIAAVSGLTPGEHVVRATLDGATAEARVTVLLGEATSVTVTPIAAGVDVMADGTDRPRRPAPSLTVPLVVGGSLATVGTLMVMGGGLAWADLVGKRDALTALQERAASGAPIDDVFVGDTRVARDDFERASLAWTESGIPLVAFGLGFAGAGVGVLVTTLALPRE